MTKAAMTKAAMNRLMKSDFFHEVCDTVKAWDYYMRVGNRVLADEMMHKWGMAKLALKHITGATYGFSRDLAGGTYSIVNEKDCNDILIHGESALIEDTPA